MNECLSRLLSYTYVCVLNVVRQQCEIEYVATNFISPFLYDRCLDILPLEVPQKKKNIYMWPPNQWMLLILNNLEQAGNPIGFELYSH